MNQAAAATSTTAAAAAAPTVRPLLRSQFRVIVREMRPHEMPAFAGGLTNQSAAAAAAAVSQPTAAPSAAQSAASAAASSPAAAAAALSPAAKRAHTFRSLLTVPAPTVTLEEDAHDHDHSAGDGQPRKGLAARLLQLMGLDTYLPARHLLASLDRHCHEAAFERFCGFRPTQPLSRVQLRALHLWMLHVRLRSAGADGSGPEALSPAMLTTLFELFWQEQRPLFPSARNLAGIHQKVYGTWLALDRGLLALLHAQAEAEQRAHARPGAAALPPQPIDVHSAAFGGTGIFPMGVPASASASVLDATSDSLLLAVLWRRVYLEDAQLNPHNLARLLHYCDQTLQMLHNTPAATIVAAKFSWLPPPSEPLPDLTPQEQESAENYYKLLQTVTIDVDEPAPAW